MGLLVEAGLEDAVLQKVDGRIISVEDFVEQTLQRIEAEQVDVDVFAIGAQIPERVQRARLIAKHYGQAGILIVVPPDEEEGLRDALRFDPFLSGHIRYQRADRPDEVAAKVNKMVIDAQERRGFGAFVDSVRDQLPKYERTARRRELFLDILLDHAPIGVLLVNDENLVGGINAEASRLLETTNSEAKGQNFASVFPENVRPALTDLMERAHNARERSESMVIAIERGETRRNLEVTAATLIELGSPYGTLIILHDVTDRLSAQQAEADLEKERAVARALEAQKEQLQRLNEELHRSNRELQDFAYAASHDLQEPLRKITTFSDLLKADHLQNLDEDAEDLLSRLQSAAVRMRDLIQSLLAFSRVRNAEVSFETVDLNEVLRDVRSDLMVSIQEASASVDVSELPSVEADAEQMRRLFQNLISNSLKFRRPGTHPSIRISEEAKPSKNGADWRRIVVSDDGIGFEEREVDKIFVPFQRLHTSYEYAGTGMGLAICRSIVERHGGTIAASSSPGQGATFTIDIPATQPS